ncbi:hypothetical protein EY06_15115, partial [Staphylococcus aureus]
PHVGHFQRPGAAGILIQEGIAGQQVPTGEVALRAARARTDRGERRLHHAAGAAGRHQHELQLARVAVVDPEAQLHAF